MARIKTTICVLGALLALSMTGCYNDEDLWNKISGLEERIEALETWQAAASSNIDALQKLINETDYITDVTPVVLGNDTIGYTIRFKNQEPATIYHGQKGEKGEKGAVPLIGIKEAEDGNWYWTLDGEFMEDTNGHLVCANGQSTAPQLKLGSQLPADAVLVGGGMKDDTAVYLSVDGGNQWAKVSGERGETGEQGPAGNGGGNESSFFKDVKVYDDYVEFILADGTQFSMSVTVENYIDINDIDWDKSNVWKVMDGDRQVAEVCKEGLGRIPGQSGVIYQIVAVYPVGEDNQVDLTKGYIAKYVRGSKGDKAIAGGSIGWKSRESYENGGSTSPLASFTPGTEGKEEISSLMITSANKIKKCNSGLNKYKLEPYTISDADQNVYPVVKIGAAYWMRENLRTTKYKDGTPLVYRRDAADDQRNETVYLNGYEKGTNYEKTPMFDYYKKDDSFDVETQTDDVKKRYGLHYNFSAVAGDFDPYVQSLGGGYEIISQDSETENNNSLCPEGWHIPTSFTHGVFGNYYADMEYVDYIFGFKWWHMMASDVAEKQDSRDWAKAQWWKSDHTPDDLTGLSIYAVPALGQTTGFGEAGIPQFSPLKELEGIVLFWVDILSEGIPMFPYLDSSNDMINNNAPKAEVGVCSFPVRCVRD